MPDGRNQLPTRSTGGGRLKNQPLPFPARVTRAIRTLAGDHRSGSVTLALRACRLLGSCKFPALESAGNFHFQVAQQVIAAQPTMAAIRNVCERWLLQLQQGSTPLHSARRVAKELTCAQSAASLHAAALLHHGQVLMTYSASSTVEAAVLAAHRKRKRFRVLCAEGRPKYEGRAMAKRLATRGVPVELFTDSALLASLAAADLLLVGCDAVFPDGFVNKVGTHALLCMSRRADIPSYIVADSFKFLPALAARSFSIREEPSSEVWKKAGKNLRVRNFYFEKVPLQTCSGLITERGVCSPKEAVLQMRAIASQSATGSEQKRSR